MEEIVEALIKSSKENNFRFNLNKSVANFKIKNFKVESGNIFKWIGKIFDLQNFELQHLLILN